MPCFDCKQLSELSSSSIFHLPNIWVVFKGLNYIKVVFLKKKISFCEQGNFEVQISQLICRNGRHALVGIHLKQTSCWRDNGTKSSSSNIFVSPWIYLFLMIGVSEAEKEKQKVELCFLCIFQRSFSHLPNYIFSSSMYGVIFSSFPHVPIISGKYCNFDFLCKVFENIHSLFILKFHLALYCLFCTGNSFF